MTRHGLGLGGILLIALSAPLSAPLGAIEFDYPDFSSIVGLNLVGSASQTGTTVLLTPASNTQAGAMWTSSPVPVATGFTTTFEYQINPPNGGADGMTFTIQGNSANEVYSPGGALAYDGMPNSLAIELDHYNNGNMADPNGNHISVHTAFAAPNSANEAQSIGAATVPNLGGIHVIRVTYEGTALSIFFDNMNTPILTVDVDLTDVVGGENGHVGFTAATGGLSEAHVVRSWSFSNGIEFIRGDANGDGAVNLEDALDLLTDIFVPGGLSVACEDGGDVDDTGTHNILDPILILNFLYLPGSLPPPAPSPACGVDPTGDDDFGCETPSCP